MTSCLSDMSDGCETVACVGQITAWKAYISIEGDLQEETSYEHVSCAIPSASKYPACIPFQ